MKKPVIAGLFLAAAVAFSGISGVPCISESMCVTASAAGKLSAPKNVKYDVSGSAVKLSWSKVSGAKLYRVFRYNSKTGKYEKLKDTSNTSLTLKELSDGTYKFRVAAAVKKNGKVIVQTLSSPVTAKISTAQKEEKDMTDSITVNTQSSIRIDAGKLIIRIDPFKISDEPHDADIIFITHAHYDHFSPDDIKKVSKPDTVFAAPASMKKELEDEGIKNVTYLSPDEATEILGIPVETVRAYNISKAFHPKKNNWLGYILTVGGKRIYAAGDTDATDEAKTVKCDIALVPIGGTYTMNAKEAAALINAIKPETAIPIHYGSIVGSNSDGEKFAKLVDSSVKVVIK